MVNQFIVVGRIKNDIEIEGNFVKVEIESKRSVVSYIDEKDDIYKAKPIKTFITNLTLYVPGEIATISRLKKGFILGFRGYIDSNRLIVEHVNYVGKAKEEDAANEEIVEVGQLSLF